MTRKQSNTVDYFPHYVKPGKTIYILEAKYGNDGYAFWFKILELICSFENHFIDCSDMATWEFLLARTHVSGITGTEILGLLANLGNLDKELWEQGRVIWCPNLIINITDVYTKRGRSAPTKPAMPFSGSHLTETLFNITENEKKENPITDTDKPHTDGISEPGIPISGIPDTGNPQSKVKYSKVKDSKGLAQKENSSADAEAHTPKISNNPYIAKMQEHLGFPRNGNPDPIPNPAKEAGFIKKMIGRGFSWDKDILPFWEKKCSGRSSFVSMQWVNEDIGDGGDTREKSSAQKRGEISGEDKPVGGLKGGQGEAPGLDLRSGIGGPEAYIHRKSGGV